MIQETPPVMISTKDLAYICDIFNWNFSASKIAYHYSLEVIDEELKDFFNEVYLMHKQICEELITLISLEEDYEQ